jgi:hypothetical protein
VCLIPPSVAGGQGAGRRPIAQATRKRSLTLATDGGSWWAGRGKGGYDRVAYETG